MSPPRRMCPSRARVAGIGWYNKWHLGVDDDMDRDTKGHYSFLGFSR